MPDPVGTVAQAKAFTAEKNVAWVRVAVIMFNVGTYYLWLSPQGVPALAMAITVVATLYGWAVALFEPYRRFPVLATSAWIAITDGTLIATWILATGGFASPYYLLWFLSLFAITFRYAWRATALSAVAYAASYAAVAVLGPFEVAGLVVRCGYILLVGAIASLLAHETQRQFQTTYQLGQAVEASERYRTLAEASPDALVIHRAGILLEANPAFCDLVGKPRSEVIGHPAAEFVEPDSQADLAQRIERPADQPLELWVHTPRGRRLVRIQGREIAYAGQRARLAAMHDVTDERQAEEARRAAERSELEVQRLREMDRFKTDFINAAAHELNTPITPLKLQLHVLKQRLGSEARNVRNLEVLERNLGRLSLLVQDMLDVARLESGRLRLRLAPMDLANLVAEIQDTFGESAARNGQELTAAATGPLPLRGDPDRLLQVLFNLVSNALKFTPQGGKVAVGARRTEAGVELVVEDTGVGLSPAQAARLFQPFGRLHQDVVDAPGTGLGLYISKGIVEAHGGELRLESPGPGKGTRAILRLPAGAA